MFFNKKKEEFQDINGLGGPMQPLTPMQPSTSMQPLNFEQMPQEMDNSLNTQPLSNLDSFNSFDASQIKNSIPQSNSNPNKEYPSSISNQEPNLNQDFSNMDANIPSQYIESNDFPKFDNVQPIYQEQQPNRISQIPNQAPSQDLPTFEKKPDNLDLLVPTPPPNLLQKKEFSINRLEEVEREFRSINSVEINNHFEKNESSPGKPIFIKVENYEVTLKNIIDMKNNVKEFSNVMFRLENIDDSQNSKFISLQNQIEDIQRKLIFIDNLIFEVQK